MSVNDFLGNRKHYLALDGLQDDSMLQIQGYSITYRIATGVFSTDGKRLTIIFGEKFDFGKVQNFVSLIPEIQMKWYLS
jgi:hypothetical protein